MCARVRCPCGAIFRISSGSAPSNATCPQCGARLTIPSETRVGEEEYRVAHRIERRPRASAKTAMSGGLSADASDLRAARSGRTLDEPATNFLDALRYPLSPRGVMMIVAGAVTIPFLRLVFHVIPFIGWLGSLFLSAYVAAFTMSVIEETCVGGEDVPDWPDLFGAWENVIRPALRAGGALAISFLPAIVCILIGVFSLGLSAFIPGEGAPGPTAHLYLRAASVLGLLGGLYLPMALLAAGATRSTGSARPTVVVPAIFVAGKDYLLVLAFVMLSLILNWGVFELFVVLARQRALGAFLLGIPSFAVNFYLTMVVMRALGLLYRRNGEKFAWLRPAR